MREFSLPALYEVPADGNLTDLVRRNAAQCPDTSVLARKDAHGHWRDVTAAAFLTQVRAAAKGLIASGVQPGDRVALMSRTRYEWTLLDFAVWSAGAVTVPVYETSSPEQIEWILKDSGAVAVVVESAAHEAAVESVRVGLPRLKHVWRLDTGGPDGSGGAGARQDPATGTPDGSGDPDSPGAPDGPGGPAVDQDLATGAPGGHEPGTVEALPPAVEALTAAGTDVSDAVLDERSTAANADSPATIVYTSGTTGRPKGCVLTHRSFFAECGNVVERLAPLFRTGHSSVLLFLPLAHVFGRLVEVAAMMAPIRLGHAPDIKTLTDDLRGFRPTLILGVPRVFEKVYNSARATAEASGRGRVFDRAAATAVAYSRALDAPGGPSLRLRLTHKVFDRLVYAKLRAVLGGRAEYAISGGAPLGERLGHFYRGIGFTVLEGYGLTESCAATAFNPWDRTKIGTVGQPLPGSTVRIADDGEVLLYGAHLFAGYWNNEAATAEAMADGWFHTGDLGALDQDGYLSITGRKKEIIVTAGGKNVAPAVIEDRVRAHALVAECMVVGDGRPFVGALITLDEDFLPRWAEQHGKSGRTAADLAADPELLAAVQGAVDEGNAAVSKAESVRAFRILPVQFTEASGHLTPSLKLKRKVVLADFADEVERLYAPRA